MRFYIIIFVFVLSEVLLLSCQTKPLPNQEMIDLLRAADKATDNYNNLFSPDKFILYADSLFKANPSGVDFSQVRLRLGSAYLELGEEQKAIDVFSGLLKFLSPFEFQQRKIVKKHLAMSYMRLGERSNCFHNHTAESCIYPISVAGRHTDKTGSEKAIEIYKELLHEDPSDLESRWLMNIAYMTIGDYPDKVPPQFLISIVNDDSLNIKPFTDVAANAGLNMSSQSGGSIVDDFNNDGYLDIITSSWSLKEPLRYLRSNGNGTFTDVSDSSWLGHLTGGLNIIQADYNNDGFKDILVLRGAWKRQFGKEPNSLLRNNADGTFSDVTKESGLLSFHPTQTATWADFNNDGWLDLFIGNESSGGEDIHPSELYVNNKNGTFKEIAALANCNVTDYVKGVASGDYNNDGKADIFISTFTGRRILLKNESLTGGAIKFKDVSVLAGFANNYTSSFPGWFFDYDNDGWLDILVCNYQFTASLGYYAAAEALQLKVGGDAGKVTLYRNNHDGTFEDVSIKTGLTKIAFAMGSNFGDIDNDGYLDFYLGTGNPMFESLVPNKLFKNVGGQKFVDITTSARVGNLQKGHGVSFADLDNDGDEDIYIEMGGAYAGDSYENSLYLNPGQNINSWLTISLEGVVSNKAGIGSRIKVCFKENGKERAVYRDVNSGGSFGANPLRQHIGTGLAKSIDSVIVYWPVTGKRQLLKNIPVNTYINIKEDSPTFNSYRLSAIDFKKVNSGLISCPPAKK